MKKTASVITFTTLVLTLGQLCAQCTVFLNGTSEVVTMNLTPKQRASINPSFIIHSSDVQCLEEGINTNVQTGALTIEVNGHEVQYPGIAVAKEDGIDFYAWKQKGGKLQLMENVLGFTAIVVSKK